MVKHSVEDGATAEDYDEDLQDEDHDEKTRRAMMEKLACPRRRRCLLTSWVSRRVMEICNEDTDEPDSEDESIRSLLMDALGAASSNVETYLSTNDLDLQDYIRGYQPVDTSPSSKVHFSDNSKMYIIAPGADSDQTLVATTCNTRWHLDQVVDAPLLDIPSSPLRKWREQSSASDDPPIICI